MSIKKSRLFKIMVWKSSENENPKQANKILLKNADIRGKKDFFISDIVTEEDLVSLVSNKLEHVDKYKVIHKSLHGFKRVDHG